MRASPVSRKVLQLLRQWFLAVDRQQVSLQTDNPIAVRQSDGQTVKKTIVDCTITAQSKLFTDWGDQYSQIAAPT